MEFLTGKSVSEALIFASTKRTSMYSSVPNRRAGPNKRAGGKILEKE